MKVSVIMSTYKTDEQQLKQSIESILNQSFKDFEFLITIDGVCNDYLVAKKIKDKRVKIINNNKNCGLPSALNHMLDIAQGEYIARMDADDISCIDRIEKQIDFLDRHNEYDVCGTYAKIIGENNFIVSNLNDYDYLKCKLLNKNVIVHPSIIIRNSFIKQHNIRYDEKYIKSQDFELYSRIKNITKIYIYPEALLYYRRGSNKNNCIKTKWVNHEMVIQKNVNELELNNNICEYLLYLDNYPYCAKKYSISDCILNNNKILTANKRKGIYNQDKLIKYLSFSLFKKKIYEKNILSLFLIKFDFFMYLINKKETIKKLSKKKYIY